jgi:hypothetical protein
MGRHRRPKGSVDARQMARRVVGTDPKRSEAACSAIR